jgi:hypothetical protein
MKPPAKLLFAASVTMIVAASWPKAAIAAEDEAQAQNLAQVEAADQVISAHWARRPDSYVLQVMVDPSRFVSARAQATANPAAPATAQQRQQTPLMTLPPTLNAAATEPVQDRGSFFIGSTIANLRGLDPTFCGRSLTLIDGRRSSGQATPTTAQPATAAPKLSVNQPYPPRFKYNHVEVWLLKADGTQILPATYSCDLGPRRPPAPAPIEITYEFPLAGGEQAAAAAIRIGDNFYIEKLQPPAPRPAAL